MCDPMTIIGAGLTAASAATNASAASAAQRARSDALAAERIRQQGFDRETAALNEASQNRYTDFGDQQQRRAGQLGDYFNQQTPQIEQATADTGAVAMAPTSSNITQQAVTQRRGEANAFNTQQGQALGNLRAFGDYLGGVSRLQARDAAQIGSIGGMKRGSQNVLGLELEQASRAGQGRRMLGDLLGGAGSLMVGAGLRG